MPPRTRQRDSFALGMIMPDASNRVTHPVNQSTSQKPPSMIAMKPATRMAQTAREGRLGRARFEGRRKSKSGPLDKIASFAASRRAKLRVAAPGCITEGRKRPCSSISSYEKAMSMAYYGVFSGLTFRFFE